MHEEATLQELTVYLIEIMNKVCGLNLKKLKVVDEQSSLF